MNSNTRRGRQQTVSFSFATYQAPFEVSPLSLIGACLWGFERGPIYVFSITIYVFKHHVLKDLYYRIIAISLFLEVLKVIKSHFQKGGADIVAGIELENSEQKKLPRRATVNHKPNLNSRQLLFCEYYLQGMPANRAYLKAGYTASNANNARRAAIDLLTNPTVRAYIDEQRKQIKKTFELNRGMLIENLLNIAMGKVMEEQPVTRLVGDGVQEIEIIKKKTNPKDRVKATEILLRLISDDDEDTLPAATESTDSKILTALRTRKVTGDEPDTPPQEESSDADNQ